MELGHRWIIASEKSTAHEVGDTVTEECEMHTSAITGTNILRFILDLPAQSLIPQNEYIIRNL